MEEEKKRLRLRAPSPAMIVAIVALVFAMTGTGIAATLVSGDGLIKKNSLSGNRLKAKSFPGARVYSTVTQDIASGAPIPLEFNAVNYNNGGVFRLTRPTALTAPRAGKYLVTASISWSNNATGVRALVIQANGTTAIASVNTGPTATNTAPEQSVATVYRLKKGGYVRALAWQTSGVTMSSWNNGRAAPTLSLDWIAP